VCAVKGKFTINTGFLTFEAEFADKDELETIYGFIIGRLGKVVEEVILEKLETKARIERLIQTPVGGEK
jgi:hypothetical protein